MEGRYVFTVSEMNQFIKELLDNVPPLQEVLLRGEISNYKVYPSGHHYFTLKDSQSSLKCVMFKTSTMRLRFRPENGMQVIAAGRISVYPRDGAYQLYCTGLTPEGVGDLSVAFEQLKEKLRKEGLFDAAHKKPLPVYPRRIAIVTSPAGAAVHDMIRILRRRYPLAKVLLLPVRVQGTEAPAEIAVPDREELLRALDSAEKRMEQAAHGMLRRQGQRLDALAEKRVMTEATAFVEDRRQDVDHLTHRLCAGMRAVADGQGRRFGALAAALDALSPLKVLGRGYAVAQRSDGTVVRSAGQVERGERLRLRLAQGGIVCEVKEKDYGGEKDV